MQSTNESQSQHGTPASRSSILGLDLLTFLMADVRDGVGPYLSVFLKGGLHWQSGKIGIAISEIVSVRSPTGNPQIYGNLFRFFEFERILRSNTK
jgi:hypothetical protein